MEARIKGSQIEDRILGQSQAELSGACMYFALARVAEELGIKEAADLFAEVALEHAGMASYYSLSAGRYPLEETDFWQFIKGLSKAEECGETAMLDLAGQVEGTGFGEEAEMVRTFASQHKHHAEITSMLLEKYAPGSVKADAERQYRCGICGYLYEGDIENEPDDFTCPLCGMPKDSFRPENK